MQQWNVFGVVPKLLLHASATASCSFNGQTIQHNQSVIAYQSSSVAYGSQCVSHQRTCQNGTLSGSYQSSTCTVQAAASCTFNGQTVAHNQAVTAFQSSSVPSGQQCLPENRTCTDGTLSGTYTAASCSVSPTPPAPAGFNEQMAITFISSMYDPSMQLLKECPTCSRYWLWSDQLLGQIVLDDSDPARATAIENKMNAFGAPMRNAWATLDPNYISKTSFLGTQEVDLGGAIWYSDYGVGGELSCAGYADVAFLKTIYKFKTGDTVGARTCYDYGKAMWDGVGMKDSGQITGQYAVYKTALGLLAQKITGFPPIGIPDDYFDKFQAANGGITTDITNGQPAGSQNIETTAAVLFAKNPGLLQ